MQRAVIEQEDFKELYIVSQEKKPVHCPVCGSEDLSLSLPGLNSSGLSLEKIHCFNCKKDFSCTDLGLDEADKARLLFDEALQCLLIDDRGHCKEYAEKAQKLLQIALAKEEKPAWLKLLVNDLSLQSILYQIMHKSQKALDKANQAHVLAYRLVELDPDLESQFLLAITCYDSGRLQKSLYQDKADQTMRYAITLLQILMMEAENKPENKENLRLIELMNLRMIFQIEGIAGDLLEQNKLEEAENWYHALIALSERYLQPKMRRPKRVISLLCRTLEKLAEIYHRKNNTEMELGEASQYLLFINMELFDHLVHLSKEDLEDYVFMEDWETVHQWIAGYEKLADHMIDLDELEKARELLEEMAQLMEKEAVLLLRKMSNEEGAYDLKLYELNKTLAELWSRLKEEEKVKAFYQKAAKALKQAIEPAREQGILSMVYDCCKALQKHYQKTHQPKKELEMLLLQKEIIDQFHNVPFAQEDYQAFLKYENDLDLAKMYSSLNQSDKALEFYQEVWRYLQDELYGASCCYCRKYEHLSKDEIREELSKVEPVMKDLESSLKNKQTPLQKQE